MRTTINIEDELLDRVAKLIGIKGKKHHRSDWVLKRL